MSKSTSSRWRAGCYGATLLIIAGLTVATAGAADAGNALLQCLLPGLVLATLAVQGLLVYRPLLRGDPVAAPAAAVDALTKIPNQQGFLDQFEIEASRVRRYRRSLSVMMVEVDHLERVVEGHGRIGADQMLRGIARLLRTSLRPTDVVGRVSDVTFGVLLPETDLTGAGLLAERIRRQIAELEIVVHERPIKVTASIGVMQLPANDTRVEPALAMLDRLTLEAKRRGRNRIVTGTVVDA